MHKILFIFLILIPLKRYIIIFDYKDRFPVRLIGLCFQTRVEFYFIIFKLYKCERKRLLLLRNNKEHCVCLEHNNELRVKMVIKLYSSICVRITARIINYLWTTIFGKVKRVS